MILSDSPRIEMLNMDCMDYLKDCRDKQFELLIADPPYGNRSGDLGGVLTKETKGRYKLFDNVAPSDSYFEELFRVAENKIICGGNYFKLPVSRGWIYWNKQTPTVNFADGELLWTSFDRNLLCFDYMWTNVKQGAANGIKWNKDANIHPTQKPVALYKWLLKNYAKAGDTILDTHGGSFSSAIACHQMGFDFVGIEKDADYFNAAVKRFKRYQSQGVLF